jgi:hypothetical protein
MNRSWLIRNTVFLINILLYLILIFGWVYSRHSKEIDCNGDSFIFHFENGIKLNRVVNVDGNLTLKLEKNPKLRVNIFLRYTTNGETQSIELEQTEIRNGKFGFIELKEMGGLNKLSSNLRLVARFKEPDCFSFTNGEDSVQVINDLEEEQKEIFFKMLGVKRTRTTIDSSSAYDEIMGDGSYFLREEDVNIGFTNPCGNMELVIKGALRMEDYSLSFTGQPNSFETLTNPIKYPTSQYSKNATIWIKYKGQKAIQSTQNLIYPDCGNEILPRDEEDFRKYLDQYGKDPNSREGMTAMRGLQGMYFKKLAGIDLDFVLVKNGEVHTKLPYLLDFLNFTYRWHLNQEYSFKTLSISKKENNSKTKWSIEIEMQE